MYSKPEKTKFKKEKKGKIKGIIIDNLAFGSFGIKSLTVGRITAKQIEACRRVISKRIKNIGKLWIRIFPSTPITLKPSGSRMGKGKGNVDHWVVKIKPGKILFEVEGVSLSMAQEILHSVSAKSQLNLSLISN